MKKIIACFVALVCTMAMTSTASAGEDIWDVNPGNEKLSFSLTNANETLVLRPGQAPDTVDYRYLVDGDLVSRGTAPLAGDLRINAKGGDDTIRLLGVSVPGDVDIEAGSGDDTVVVDAPAIAGDLAILGLAGADTIRVIGPAEENGQSHSLVEEPVTDDIGGALTILGGPDADFIRVRNVSIAESLLVRAGTDNADDEVIVADSSIGTTVRIEVGAGDDYVRVGRTEVGGDASVSTATGDDRVQVNASAFASNLTVNTGAREDTVRAARNLVEGDATFHGGANYDLEAIDNNAVNGELTIRSFEGEAEDMDSVL